MDLTREDAYDGVSALTEPVRRTLYEYVAAHDDPVRRDEAAKAVGITRTLAAYHLDRLVDAGLLLVSRARRRGGPGAGRPAKLYSRAVDAVTVSVPPRDYELLAQLMVGAVESDSDGTLRGIVNAAARDQGRRAGAEYPEITDALRSRGYEPATTADDVIELRNCPFHRLAREHVDLVCGLNHELVCGLLEGCGQDADRAELVPRENRCCVQIRPQAAVGGPGAGDVTDVEDFPGKTA